MKTAQLDFQAELIETIIQRQFGWEAAFGQLMEKYSKTIWQRCNYLLNDPDDAEDVAQEVLIRAFRFMHQYRGQASFKTWLLHITDNQCFSYLKQKKREHELQQHYQAFMDTDDQVDNNDVLETADQNQLIERVMQVMQPMARDILSLRYWLAMPIGGIADLLHIGISAAKMRLKRALQQCQSVLQRTLDLDGNLAA